MKPRASILFLLILSTMGFLTAAQNADIVRPCLYVPGVSAPAQMPDEVTNPIAPTQFPTAALPSPTEVDPATIEQHLNTFNGLWNAVNDHYVYTDFRGHNWHAIGEKYKSIVQAGLSDDDFEATMQAMINELGDNHSYFQSAETVQKEEEALANGQNFVGIGALFKPILANDTAAILSVFPDSPAQEAGLLPHDTLLMVDGGPIRDEFGTSRTRGPEGTEVTLTMQRPGQAPNDIVLIRRRVTGALPMDYCIMPDIRIGYIFFPTFLDETIDDQTRDALQKMTADGPLEGLILDNRMNGGGSGSVGNAVMGMFTSGLQGYYVSRETREELTLEGEDIGGSQTVPLVVLVDVDTVSLGEITSGVLRLDGRAVVMGGPTLGNVEQLRRYDFEDGSRAWIASATFEPLGQSNGIWEDTGIIPDVLLPTRWDLFTEETDPALAKAVEMLMQE